MDPQFPIDAVLGSTVAIAQELLAEKPFMELLMPSLIPSSSPDKPLRLGRRRNDQHTSDDDADDDLDLLVFARLQKRRRPSPAKADSATNNDSDSSSMSDPGVLYPTVSLHEPEVVVNGQQQRAVMNNKALPESTGSDSSPFMQYLKGCPDLTFETQFKLSRETFSVRMNLRLFGLYRTNE